VRSERARVLVAVGDPETRGLVARRLAEAGHSCVVAGAGDDAVALAEEAGDLDAAVIDLDLAEQDGVELALTLKRRAGAESFLPVVLLGAGDQVEERVRGFAAGCDDFLTRPISVFELEARLAALLLRRAEHEQLARANVRLREAHEKKRELAALVVHDLRSPLSALQGSVELLRHHLRRGSRDAVAAVLDDMDELAAKALTLVASILDVEEMEEGLLRARPEEVDVERLLRAVARHHDSIVRARGLAMDFQVQSGLGARLDPQLVSRVVENLLDNAVRYAPRDGRVVVGADLEEGALVIRVGNDGPPVPASERARIFDRFYRLEERRAGARANRGLGLYFCRLAAEDHGGDIAIEEMPGLPTCFAVRLPQ
jgi:signal transduction histidine kinase